MTTQRKWSQLSAPDRLLLIHMDAVTNSAPARKPRKHREGLALTVSLALVAAALLVFGL